MADIVPYEQRVSAELSERARSEYGFHGSGRDGDYIRKRHMANEIEELRQALARDTATRIGTAEREQALDELSQHYAEGRITLDELHERIAIAARAAYPAELRALLTDVPKLPRVIPVQPPAEPEVKLVPMPRKFREDFAIITFTFIIAVILAHYLPYHLWPF